MKIRNGFVSNSSSSSYVIVVRQKDHDEIVECMHPYYKAWFDDMGKDKQKLFGEDVYVMSVEISSEDEQPMQYDGELPPEAEKFWGSIYDEEKEEWIEDCDHDVHYVPGDEIMGKYRNLLDAHGKQFVFNEERS